MRILPLLPAILIACESEEGVKVYNSNPEIAIISHTDGEEFLGDSKRLAFLRGL